LFNHIDCSKKIPQDQDHEANQKALEKVVGMTRVFSRLHKHYAQSIRAWTRFSGTGDLEYFADLRMHPLARDALSDIEKSFEKIHDLEHRMSLKEGDCVAAVKIVSYTMSDSSSILNPRSARSPYNARE
jgi:hypothetical protein